MEREREREREEGKVHQYNTTHSFGFHFIGNIRRKRLHTSLSLKSKLSLKMSSLYSSGLAQTQDVVSAVESACVSKTLDSSL